jgi:hypothetical protein
MNALELDTPGWRVWLAEHAATADEAWLAVPRGRHPEAVEQALCFGWIDSLARRDGDGRFVQRFSPRRRGRTTTASRRPPSAGS